MSSSDDQPAGVIGRNRVYWERLAPHRHGQPAAFFLDGGSALSAAETAAFGELDGRRVLHLACSTGDEAISLAQRGAVVTGVDFAAGHLATARAKAAEVGVSVRFLDQDMTRLAPDLTGFDLVYISWGGLCWAPDLTAWAALVAGRLAPGGLLAISEHHPLWEILTVRGLDRLAVSGDYFGLGRDGYADPAKAPQVTRVIGVPDDPHRSYVWGVGAVIGAVLGAGLSIGSFQEFAEPEMYDGLGERAALLPATYLLTARRTAGD